MVETLDVMGSLSTSFNDVLGWLPVIVIVAGVIIALGIYIMSQRGRGHGR